MTDRKLLQEIHDNQVVIIGKLAALEAVIQPLALEHGIRIPDEQEAAYQMLLNNPRSARERKTAFKMLGMV